MSLTMPNNQYGNFVQGQRGGSVQMINSAGSFAVPGRVASQYQCINPGNVSTLRLQKPNITIEFEVELLALASCCRDSQAHLH